MDEILSTKGQRELLAGRDDDLLFWADIQNDGVVTIKSDLLEPQWQQMVMAMPEKHRYVYLKDSEGKQVSKFYNIPLLEMLPAWEGAEDFDKRILDFGYKYVEEPVSGAFNLIPLLLVGTSSAEGASLSFGPVTVAQQRAYVNVLEEAATLIYRNLLQKTSSYVGMYVKKGMKVA